MSKRDLDDPMEKEELIFLKLNSENIIEVEVDSSLHLIKKRHLVYINQEIHRLGGGKKMPIYICVHGYLMFDKGARKYRATKDYATYRLANAFLIDSLSKSVVYRFYLYTYDSIVPVNAFPLREQAIKWLKDLSEKS